MTDLGKIDEAFFTEHVYPYLGASRDDVTLGPRHGVDFGMIEVGGEAVVLATDPISILPDLGFERAAWFAFHVVLSDVAVSGLPPTHLAVNLNLPPEMSDDEFETVWKTFDREAREFGVSVVTGHTARYTGCQFPWVGGATTIAVGDIDDVVRPDGAEPGDHVLVTKGPGVEATGLLTTLFPDQMDLPADDLATAQSRLDDVSPVRDALTAAAAGPVHAMHDATEGGLQAALVEMADAAGVRFDIDRDRVPFQPGVRVACDAIGIDPWTATSEGTLVIAVPPDSVDPVLDALDAEGVPAADVGTVSDGSGVYVDGERVEHPQVDPSWEAYARFLDGA